VGIPLRRKFWEKRAKRLFAEWDSCEDPYRLPILEFQKVSAKVQEACTITMLLDTMDKEVEKAVDRTLQGARQAFAGAVEGAQHA